MRLPSLRLPAHRLLQAAILILGLSTAAHAAAKPKMHSLGLGAVKKVPYSILGDPSGAAADEKELRVRPLIVDGMVKEWTTGDTHDITDRSFVVRRALRLNDNLPGDQDGKSSEKPRTDHWIWQRGPWLLVDRVTRHDTPLHLPDYDPAVSNVVWFRDYAAYCGLTSGGKSLFAVVAQVGGRKPLLAKKLHPWDSADHPSPGCGLEEWQRDPLRVTFHPTGSGEVSFDLVGLSAVLVEDGDADPDPGKDASP